VVPHLRRLRPQTFGQQVMAVGLLPLPQPVQADAELHVGDIFPVFLPDKPPEIFLPPRSQGLLIPVRRRPPVPAPQEIFSDPAADLRPGPPPLEGQQQRPQALLLPPQLSQAGRQIPAGLDLILLPSILPSQELPQNPRPRLN